MPATSAVTSVDAQTVIHVFGTSADWRLDALSEAERAALTPAQDAWEARALDEVETAIMAALRDDARASAASMAARTRHPESTVCRRLTRRLTRLLADGQLVTEVVVDPRRPGLLVDANIMIWPNSASPRWRRCWSAMR